MMTMSALKYFHKVMININTAEVMNYFDKRFNKIELSMKNYTMANVKQRA
ncbi:hypothetical protein [Namhaeicola litoreus]|uniref:Uncharacterized protein n=1 Tax=Namhaeicola litoreus TaxID=1052145 RepID=A0ABW3XZY4_9FLAO